MNKKFLILISFCTILLIIPNVYSDCEFRDLKETVYLNPNDLFYRCMWFVETTEDEGKEFILQWNFKTYNNSFTVNFSKDLDILSNGKTKDHGEVDKFIGVVTDFYIRNTDIIGGYIDIDIHLKEEIIINSYELIIVFMTISVISVAILFKKKFIKT